MSKPRRCGSIPRTRFTRYPGDDSHLISVGIIAALERGEAVELTMIRDDGSSSVVDVSTKDGKPWKDPGLNPDPKGP